MSEEIKEIIDYLIDEECTRRIKCITIEESKQLLDYITNLQQENENLKQTLHNITINGVEEENTSVLDLIKENERLKVQLNGCDELLDNDTKIIDVYKSRIDKAIEILEQDKSSASFNTAERIAINILNGSDEKMIDKEKDIDYILEKELSPDRYCYIHNFIVDKNKEINRLNNIINEVNKQLNYLETYSSKEDVFEDMKRRLDNIEKIINRK